MQGRLLRIGPVGTGVAGVVLALDLGRPEQKEKTATGFSDPMLQTS